MGQGGEGRVISFSSGAETSTFPCPRWLDLLVLGLPDSGTYTCGPLRRIIPPASLGLQLANGVTSQSGGFPASTTA